MSDRIPLFTIWLAMLVGSLLWAGGARAGDGTAGLLLRSGEGHYRPAPRLSAVLTVTVSGPIATAHLEQRFKNTGDQWLEGLYLFPLPDDAAVDHLTMRIGDRLIEGRIAERQAAKRAYEQAKSRGNAAALIEGERPNLFTASVANIPPRADITVSLSFQTRAEWQGDRYRLHLPTVVAPRYLPPLVVAESTTSGAGSTVVERLVDGDRITPPIRVPGNGNPIEIAVTIDAGMPLRSVDSDSHAIRVEELTSGLTRVRLETGAAPADRDFLLAWAPDIGATPRPVLFDEVIDDNRYLSLLVMPPNLKGMGAILPRDVIFILDRSGSMHGESIEQAKTALADAIDRLDRRDRFNIIHFSNTTGQLFSAPKPATPNNRNQAKRLLRGIAADGGTEMLPALKRAFSSGAAPDRLRQIVLLTDGAIGNERDVLALAAEKLGAARLFPVAIGSAPNTYLMSRLARFGRGKVTLINDPSQTGQRMADLFEHLSAPAVTDLSVTLPDGGGEIFPLPLADLYRGEPLVVSARLAAAAGGSVHIKGRIADQEWAATLPLQDAHTHLGIGRLWARDKIRWLQERAILDGADGLKAAVVPIALRHGLVTRYTSLLAISETIDRPPEETLDSTRIAGNLPKGWTAPSDPSGARQLPTAPRLQKIGSGRSASLTLPKTATPAPLWIAVGIGIGLIGFLLLVIVGRVRPTG
jgi:Ca-activated chloride channel family protein